MNVGELIDLLKCFPPTRTVVLSEDSEGNSASPLSEVVPGHFEPGVNLVGLALGHRPNPKKAHLGVPIPHDEAGRAPADYPESVHATKCLILFPIR